MPRPFHTRLKQARNKILDKSCVLLAPIVSVAFLTQASKATITFFGIVQIWMGDWWLTLKFNKPDFSSFNFY